MDGMYSAIKNRRGGLINDDEENAHQMPEEKPQSSGMNMESLVSALSDSQKSQLLSLLVGGGEQAPKNAVGIEQGGMGPGEEAEIEASLGEGQDTEASIAEDMISSSDKMRAERGDKPRNLGERMKFDLATKQKKGK